MCVLSLQHVRLVSTAIAAASRVLSVSTATGRVIMSPVIVNVSLDSSAPSVIKVSCGFHQSFVHEKVQLLSLCLSSQVSFSDIAHLKTTKCFPVEADGLVFQ